MNCGAELELVSFRADREDRGPNLVVGLRLAFGRKACTQTGMPLLCNRLVMQTLLLIGCEPLQDQCSTERLDSSCTMVVRLDHFLQKATQEVWQSKEYLPSAIPMRRCFLRPTRTFPAAAVGCSGTPVGNPIGCIRT